MHRTVVRRLVALVLTMLLAVSVGHVLFNYGCYGPSRPLALTGSSSRATRNRTWRVQRTAATPAVIRPAARRSVPVNGGWGGRSIPGCDRRASGSRPTP